ncbi:MAG TPA: fibronectin type III domain-containing protein [Nitrosopumilaceae archaeon]|nr:fibronectin type III domain-containing protein [Nitrosopumilaceae archaeon]
MRQIQSLDKLMNSKFIAITLAIIISIIALDQFHSVNAELQTGKSYIIYANGHDVGNNIAYTLELQLLIGSGSSNKIPIYLVEGLIIHDGQDFITSSNWKGTLLKNDGLIMLSGNATTYDGTQLSMILFGKLVNNTEDGANYKLVGRLIHKKQPIILTQITEIIDVHSLTQKQIYKEMPHIFINQNKDLQRLEVQPTKKIDAITVIVKQPGRVYTHNYIYSVTAKVYLLKENPKDDFYLHGGEVQGAHINISIINQNDEIVESFDGITDRFGFFSNLFIIPDDFTAGTYVVHVTAEKDGINDTDDSVLYVFHPPIREAAKTVAPVISPDSPTGLAATTQNKNKIDLSWIAPTTVNVRGYEIDRESPVGAGWIILTTVMDKKTNYSDKGLQSKTEYNYRVSAIYVDHTSGPSNAASAITK